MFFVRTEVGVRGALRCNRGLLVLRHARDEAAVLPQRPLLRAGEVSRAVSAYPGQRGLGAKYHVELLT